MSAGCVWSREVRELILLREFSELFDLLSSHASVNMYSFVYIYLWVSRKNSYTSRGLSRVRVLTCTGADELPLKQWLQQKQSVNCSSHIWCFFQRQRRTVYYKRLHAVFSFCFVMKVCLDMNMLYGYRYFLIPSWLTFALEISHMVTVGVQKNLLIWFKMKLRPTKHCPFTAVPVLSIWLYLCCHHITTGWKRKASLQIQ